MARKSAVPTEDIPAVTQLFTPHWIVRYLVENSLGRLWLLNRPDSRLREQMPYYIEGEAGDRLPERSPNQRTSACSIPQWAAGTCSPMPSICFASTQEEGYAPSEIPGLILGTIFMALNLSACRAARGASFDLQGPREVSRTFFQSKKLVHPHILVLQDVRLDQGEVRTYMQASNLSSLFNEPMLRLLYQFEEATTCGSLIKPCIEETDIVAARAIIEAKPLSDDLLVQRDSCQGPPSP